MGINIPPSFGAVPTGGIPPKDLFQPQISLNAELPPFNEPILTGEQGLQEVERSLSEQPSGGAVSHELHAFLHSVLNVRGD